MPPLEGSESRHVLDAKAFISSGMVDPNRFKSFVEGIPESVYSKYPMISPAAVRAAVDDFLSSFATSD